MALSRPPRALAPFHVPLRKGLKSSPATTSRRSLLRTASLKFAVIGDSGQWSTAQRETAAQLAAQRANIPFELVLMLGDNNYGDGSPESYRVRFEQPYKPLLDAGVKFYAARGNHDAGAQWEYPLFNMGGERLLHVPAKDRPVAAARRRSRAVLRARLRQSR